MTINYKMKPSGFLILLTAALLSSNVAVAADDPVFRLFGKSIGWHLKTGPHSITHEDWRWFMDYARTELAW